MRVSTSNDQGGITQLLVVRNSQRGNLFYEARDYHQCLCLMKTAMNRYGCSLHAYVLLPEDIYLLLSATGIDCVISCVERFGYNYATYFNVTHRRIYQTLQTDSSFLPVNTVRQVLSYCRYVELAAVRAGLADHPADYPWSSYGCNAMGEDFGLVSPHANYLALGSEEADRREHYRQLFESRRQYVQPDRLQL